MPISFESWLKKSAEKIRNDPLTGLPRSLYYVYVSSLLSASKYKVWGTNIFERDWDLLIILDACRVDAIREVADEYSYIDTVNSIRSVGSTSFEWLPLTFQKKYKNKIRNTAYVSGNPYIKPVFVEKKVPPIKQPIPFGPRGFDVVDPDDFLFLDEVRKYGVDDEKKCVLPRTMTDRAVHISRSKEPERLIIHYMQPHEPHIGEKNGLGGNVFVPLRKGKITRQDAWESYIENLRLVLDEIKLLLDNVSANKAIITADHGEAFGEFGFYGHQIGCPLPAVRRVPWIETTATDNKTYHPEIMPEKNDDPDALKQHLAELGYL
jgi:hypothetical protein